MNEQNFVKQRLAAGRPVLGLWSIIGSDTASEVLASAGLDFLILDMEHGPFTLPALESSIRACETAGCSPIVRVPGNHPTTVQSCLDLGAHGVVVPQIANASGAADAARSMRYAPAGTRGYNPFTRAGEYGRPGAPKARDGFGLSSLIIENRTAYDDLDRILEIADLDMIYLGVYDMSMALGCAGNVTHPDVLRFVETAVPRIRKAGKAAGLMAWTPDEIERCLSMGANVIVCGVDTSVIRGAVGRSVAAFRAAAKEPAR